MLILHNGRITSYMMSCPLLPSTDGRDLVALRVVTYSPALTCLSQLGSGTSANEGTEGGAEGGGAEI